MSMHMKSGFITIYYRMSYKENLRFLEHIRFWNYKQRAIFMTTVKYNIGISNRVTFKYDLKKTS